MRQVNRDELVWDLYSGLRAWTISVRRRLFAPPHLRREATSRIHCAQVTVRLAYLDILDPQAGYRRINGEEQAAILVEAMPGFPGAVPKLWLSGVKQRELEAQAAAANLFADGFDRFEILTGTQLGQSGLEVFFPQIAVAPHALRATWP